MKVKAWQFEREYHKVMTSFVQVFDSVNNPPFQFFEILKSKNCWFWCFERKNQNWRATGSGCFKHWKNLWIMKELMENHRFLGGSFFFFLFFFENDGHIWELILCVFSNSGSDIKNFPDNQWRLIASFATCTTLVMTALSIVLPSKCLKVEIFLLSCRYVYIWLLDVLSGYSSSLIDEGQNMELGVCTIKAERPSS